MSTSINKIRRFEFCNIDVHKSSFAKHSRIKIHLNNEMIVPQNFFNEQSSSTQHTIKNIILNF